MLHTEVQECSIPVGEALFPLPFPRVLEFNPPVHGTWNIVHIGMNVPEAVQIYVCAINCMRGVVLTAAEMGCQERFSCVILEEKDIVNGTVEDVTIEGVAAVLNRMEKLPPVVLLFTVCTHHFIGCSLNRIYQELEKRFPDVVFARCFMDPIMQKRGLTPDQKLRRAMGELLADKNSGESSTTEADSLPHKTEKTVSILGCDFSLDADCDLKKIFAENGIPEKEIQDCVSFDEYRSMGEAPFYVCTYPPGTVGISRAAERLGKQFFYLPSCFGYGEIEKEWKTVWEEICKKELPAARLQAEREACERALADAKEVIQDTPIYIDGSVHPRPLGLARLLLEHGFAVQKVYLDVIGKEEERDYVWLKENHGDLMLTAIIQPEGRVCRRGRDEKVLAVGQKAAWYGDTPYFVNLVQGGGLWGFEGIRRMAALMTEAFLTEKDTRDLVPRKGLGCASCIGTDLTK